MILVEAETIPPIVEGSQSLGESLFVSAIPGENLQPENEEGPLQVDQLESNDEVQRSLESAWVVTGQIYEGKRKRKKKKKNKIDMTPTISPTHSPSQEMYNAFQIPESVWDDPRGGLSIPEFLITCIENILPQRRTRRKRKKRPNQKKRRLVGDEGGGVFDDDVDNDYERDYEEDAIDFFDYENEDWELFSATRNLVDTDTGLNQFGWNSTRVREIKEEAGSKPFNFNLSLT